MLVVGNGSARRTEKAPGHLDPRAAAFDEALGQALRAPSLAVLAEVDLELARELWADVEPIRALGDLLSGDEQVTIDHDDDPYGVQYWVLRWSGPGGATQHV